MAYIQKRKTKDGIVRYRVQIRLKGYPIQCETFDRLTDAKEWVQQTEAAIKDGRHFKTSEAKKHTLAELIDRYMKDYIARKVKSKQEGHLLWWKAHLGKYVLADITPALIAEYRDKLSNENTRGGTRRAPATVLRYLAGLSHCLTMAVNEYGWLDDSPMRKVTKPKQPRGRVRFLSEDERLRLLEACKASLNPYVYVVVMLALATGMRLGEIMSLTWGAVDLKRGRIILHETKNGEQRVVHLSPHILAMLNDYSERAPFPNKLLFPAQKGQKPQKPQKPAGIRSAWKSALKKACVDDFRFHDLRHTAASYLVMNGASLAETGEILGHRTLAMVKRYAHFCDSHTAGVLARMNEKIFGS